MAAVPGSGGGEISPRNSSATGAGPTGWSVEWTRQSPIVISPDGLAVHLQADDTKTVDTAPAATFTWFPDGVDTSLSDDPPGRPASTVP